MAEPDNNNSGRLKELAEEAVLAGLGAVASSFARRLS